MKRLKNLELIRKYIAHISNKKDLLIFILNSNPDNNTGANKWK